jgi:hypothetical protein
MAARIGDAGDLWSEIDQRRCSLRDATDKLRGLLTDGDWSEALAASTRRPVSRKAPTKASAKAKAKSGPKSDPKRSH